MATSLNKVITRNADNTINTSTNYSELNVKASNLTNNLVTHLEAQITTMEGAMQAKEGAVDVKIASLASVGTSTYTTPYLDRSLSMISKAEFNAVAAERRANRAGSGFDEWGKHVTAATNVYASNINEGMWVYSSTPNNLGLGRVSGSDSSGISKSDYPYICINGNTLKLDKTLLAHGYDITLPPAPTVLPSTATLTAEQTASGVIKHADASNSGLIIGGTGLTGTTFSQVITTVNGKKYTIEYVDNAVRKTLDVTATASTYTVSLSGTNITQVAVFPADSISRSDLVFLESWHENVSEKDFVYPLGNVQYLGTTSEGVYITSSTTLLSTIAGATWSGTEWVQQFGGAITYSLFSDTWQADGALVGKGFKWSTLTDLQRKDFVANPENNCYLDGDKVIQVRYRMRTTLGGSLLTVGVQGKAVTQSTALFSTPVATDNFRYYNTSTTYSYNEKCGAIEIANVGRRNQGGYNLTYNKFGTKTMLMTPASIADCFTEANYTVATGYIGTSTSRPDGLFYDQVDASDIYDNRKATRVGVKSSVVSTTTIGQIGDFGFGVGIAPSYLTSSFGLLPMAGYDDRMSDNYGNYVDATGSVMVFIPKFYYKITNDITSPYNGTKVEVSDVPATGFVIHRAFVNKSVIQDGFFFDKYICGNVNSKFVSKRNIDPVSTATSHNPIMGITGVTANTYDKIFQAVKSRGANYAVPTMFMYNALALLSLAHAQSATVSTAAWMDVSPYAPKGCNNNALKDVNDASVVYVTAGNVTYPAAPLNASCSDSVFAKITHNGQKCGVTDLNGNMYEIASGFIQSVADTFHILKETIDIKTLTGLVVGDATDNWNVANYDPLTLPFTPDETSVTFGNGTAAVFSGSVNTASNDYRLDMCGVPLATGGAPARFGGDTLNKYSVASMCPIVGGHWFNNSSAGVWDRYWTLARSSSYLAVGGRACLLGA